jgi:hypothetical protein
MMRSSLSSSSLESQRELSDFLEIVLFLNEKSLHGFNLSCLSLDGPALLALVEINVQKSAEVLERQSLHGLSSIFLSSVLHNSHSSGNHQVIHYLGFYCERLNSSELFADLLQLSPGHLFIETSDEQHSVVCVLNQLVSVQSLEGPEEAVSSLVELYSQRGTAWEHAFSIKCFDCGFSFLLSLEIDISLGWNEEGL